MKPMRIASAAALLSITLLSAASRAAESTATHPFGKRERTVEHMNGEREPTVLPAEIQWVSEPWLREKPDENTQMPYLLYLAPKDRLLMLVEAHQPIQTAFITSDDHGKTWSERRWLRTDAQGQPNAVALGLTDLGDGKLMAYPENAAGDRWLSRDYGETWQSFAVKDTVAERYIWDPLCVLGDAAAGAKRLLEESWRPTGIAWGSADGPYSQGYMRTSDDSGLTWSDEVKVPQWLGVNEVNIIRAANGNLVAACRTDNPKRFAHFQLDHFSGLAVCISKDGGKSWSEQNPLYEWGRHHPSMVLTPGGDIVMTYVVRLGYPATHEGRPQFGVEAIVSRDNGQTWDKDHRYVLAKWEGNITGPNAWFCGVQSTSTVRLPDGMFITAFGTGFRNAADTKVCKMDVAIVRWRLE